MKGTYQKIMALLLTVTLLFSGTGTVFASDEPPVMDSNPQTLKKEVSAADPFSGGTPELSITVTQDELNTLLDSAGPTGITLDEGALAVNPAEAALIASGVRAAITESGDLLLEQRDLGNNCTALILARRDAGGANVEHVAVIGVNGNSDVEYLIKADIRGESLYLYDSEKSSWSSLPAKRAAMAASSFAHEEYDTCYYLKAPTSGYAMVKVAAHAQDSPFARMEQSLHINKDGAKVPLAVAWITGPSDPIPAGKSFDYILHIKTEAPPSFLYSDIDSQHLYDHYDNVKLYFVVPKGVEIGVDDEVKLADASKGLYYWDKGTTFGQGGAMYGTNIGACVKNGVTPNDKTFPMTEAYLTAKVSVEDKNTGETRIYDETNGMRFEAKRLPTVQNAAEEDWLITKTIERVGGKDYVVLGDELTLKYNIDLKLDPNTGFPTGNSDYYGRYGRLNFKDFVLTDSLPVITQPGGIEVKPLRSKMTMTEWGGSNAKEIASGGLGETELVASGENGYQKRAYPQYNLGDKTPYESYYHVTAVYSYSELKEAFYNMPIGTDRLLLDNVVTLKYKQPGAPDDDTDWVTKTAHAESNFAAEFAPIRIEKLIRIGTGDLPNQHQDYRYNQPLATTTSGFPGKAVFQITDDKGQPTAVYSKAEDGQYTLLDKIEIDPINNPACDGYVTVYAKPGTYTVTETEAPDHTELNNVPQSVTAAIGTQAEVKFVNKMTYGILRFKKMGMGVNNGLTNQTWGLPNIEFKVEVPGWNSITATSDSEGEVSCLLPEGTAMVTETTPPGYVSAGPWTVEIKPRAYSTIGNNPDADGVAQIINQKNETLLEVNKQVKTGLGTSDIPVPDRPGFAFTIERKTSGGGWEEVPGLATQKLAADKSSFTVTLPVYKDLASPLDNPANQWEYRVKETSKPADYMYQSQYTSVGTLEMGKLKNVSIINTRLVSVSGTKTWADNNDAAGKRPTYITVNLLRNSLKVDSKEIDSTSNWKWSFPDLLQLDADGKAYRYTLTEDPVNGYITSYHGSDITNTWVIPTLSVSGTKNWQDYNGSAGKRPTSITVNLLQNGTKIDTQSTDSSKNWKYTFADLPSTDNNAVPYVYTVTEDPVAKYTTTYRGFDITNTTTIPMISVSGVKTWVDYENAAGKRPASVTVNLLRDGVKLKSQQVDAAGMWKYTFADLPQTDEKDVPYTYTVEEEPVPEYVTTYAGYNIINTRDIPTISLSGMKTWADSNNAAGKRPATITVNLLRDATKVDSKQVDQTDAWKYIFDNLPTQAIDGHAYVYTVTEDPVADYTASYNDGLNITNTLIIPYIDISGKKTWSDNNDAAKGRPASITVNLLRDGVKIDSKRVDAASDWLYTFSQLPKADVAGTAYHYTVSEDPVQGYRTEYNGCDITNTWIVPKISVGGTKTWEDNNNAAGKRPASITVNLLRDGKRIDSKKVDAASGWRYEFDGLPDFSDANDRYIYDVTEDAVEGYVANYKGNDIINSLIVVPPAPTPDTPHHPGGGGGGSTDSKPKLKPRQPKEPVEKIIPEPIPIPRIDNPTTGDKKTGVAIAIAAAALSLITLLIISRYNKNGSQRKNTDER